MTQNTEKPTNEKGNGGMTLGCVESLPITTQTFMQTHGLKPIGSGKCQSAWNCIEVELDFTDTTTGMPEVRK